MSRSTVATTDAGAEWVDEVDASNRVIGRVRRADLRRRNLWHRACYIVVLDGAGRIFVHQRTAGKDIFPSHFDMMVGGVVGAGESFAAAARREVEEELGTPALDLQRVGSLRYEDATNRVFGEVFECRAEEPFHLQAEEIVAGEWVPVGEVREKIDELPFCPDSVAAFHIWLAARSQAPAAVP